LYCLCMVCVGELLVGIADVINQHDAEYAHDYDGHADFIGKR